MSLCRLHRTRRHFYRSQVVLELSVYDYCVQPEEIVSLLCATKRTCYCFVYVVMKAKSGAFWWLRNSDTRVRKWSTWQIFTKNNKKRLCCILWWINQHSNQFHRHHQFYISLTSTADRIGLLFYETLGEGKKEKVRQSILRTQRTWLLIYTD